MGVDHRHMSKHERQFIQGVVAWIVVFLGVAIFAIVDSGHGCQPAQKAVSK